MSERQITHHPIGTNLFDADQATAMVRYMIEGAPKYADRTFDRVFKLLGITAAAQSPDDAKTFAELAADELRRVMHA